MRMILKYDIRQTNVCDHIDHIAGTGVRQQRFLSLFAPKLLDKSYLNDTYSAMLFINYFSTNKLSTDWLIKFLEV